MQPHMGHWHRYRMPLGFRDRDDHQDRRERADTKVKETVNSDNAMPQFRISVKPSRTPARKPSQRVTVPGVPPSRAVGPKSKPTASDKSDEPIGF